jgi:hypothetical protein
VFAGKEPVIEVMETEAMEIGRVGAWLSDRMSDGMSPDELAVIVRSGGQTERARAAVTKSGQPSYVLDDRIHPATRHVAHSGDVVQGFRSKPSG